MDRGEVLRCKPGSNYEFNYDAHTFSGYLYVDRLAFENLDKITVDRIIKEIDFNSVQHVRDVMREIQKLGPEFKITGHHAIESIPGEAFGTTDNGIVAPASAIEKMETKAPAIKAEPKKDQPSKESTPKSNPPAPNAQAIQAEQGKYPKEKVKSQKGDFVKSVTNLKDLPNAFKEQKQAQKATQPAPKIEQPSKVEAEVKQPSPEPVKSDIGLWPGTIRVGIDSYFGAGYCLAHIFGKDNEQEAVIYCSPKGFNQIESLPLIFAKEGQVKYFLEAISKHPSFSLSVQGFNYYRLKDFDQSSIETMAYLVRDPKTYLDAVSSTKGS